MNRQDNTQIIDPFLLEILEQRREQSEITDILRTIQDDQNEIVDYDFGKNMVVQGCAGSGKTMILFHRLANILYNIEDLGIPTSRIVVIVPNDDFRKYMNTLVWSLGIDNIKMMTMNEYLLSKLEDVLIGIFKDSATDVMASGKHKEEKNDILPSKISELREQLRDDLDESEEIVFNGDDAKNMKIFIEQYEEKHWQMKTERIKERDARIARIRDNERAAHEKWLKKTSKEIRDYREEAIDEFTQKFLNGKINRSYMLGLLNAVCTNDELLDYRPKPDNLLMIDEGQDYGFLEYETIKIISPKCIVNIYGDVDQKIFDRGINEWSKVEELFNVKHFELNQDYRNSRQVVNFVNETFDKNIISIGIDAKDVEEVKLDKLPIYLEYEGEILKHNIAIISEVPEKYKVLPEKIKVLTVKQAKGLEFDTVFVSPEIAKENDAYKYVAYTRALSHLYILHE